jgi:hypothetical protein
MATRSRLKIWVPATAIVVGLSFLVAWFFSWPAEKALFLAPIIVMAVGALAFLAVLWIRIAWVEFSTVRHKRRWLGALAALVLLGIVLGVLGIELPKFE